MKIVYSAPNRAHHYSYACQMHSAGILKTFVSGFPRYSPRSPIPEIGDALRRVDQIQTIFIASQKLQMPRFISEELAYRAQIQIDHGSRQPLKGADLFLFYNGCGLDSARWFKRNGGITVVEAVNSHVLVQEEILAEEHRRLGLSWRPFHPRQVRRRVAEVEEADYVLLPSIFVAKSFLVKGIPPERLLKVPYPMKKIAGAGGFELKNRDKDSVFRVLYVGSISVRKGLRYLMEAFRHLKHLKKELWIVGPIANPSGLEDVTLPEGTKLLGSLKGDALQEAYLRATVFCLPSIEDGFGLVLMEALYYGLPVIATENTGIEDLTTEGKAGMTVPIRDSAAISNCLNRLAEDRDLLARKRMEAKEEATRLAKLSRDDSLLASTLMKTIPSPSFEICKPT